ncbi:hypothetical protein V1522DRAFT_423928 [Lipomyces starkeyi]
MSNCMGSCCSGGEAVPEDDERMIADLMVGQLEFADVIIVNKIDSVDANTLSRIKNVIVTLNPRATVSRAIIRRLMPARLSTLIVLTFSKQLLVQGGYDHRMR